MSLLTLAELRLGAELSTGRLLNGGIWVIRLALGLALVPLVTLSVPVSLFDGTALGFVPGFALFLTAMDLGEYAFHRAQHAIPWLWTLHALHHSDPDMNATTTERHFWGDALLKAVTIRPAAALIVHPTVPIIFAYAVCSLWNYVCHARLPLTFGRLSWALNSPAYHRRHHSALAEHHNSNFAALLPLWDVMFGAYRVPSKAMPPTGLGYEPTPAQAFAWPFYGTVQ
jgi:sterol desaturase/sphingolipid hydroxylase (fatty acid hydroxylase superfamily)